MASGGLIPMQMFEEDPGFVRLLEGLRSLGRVVVFDRRGLGLSDPCRFEGASLPNLEQMAHLASAAIPAARQSHHTLVHGDFCFSNIFYDFRSQRIRVIDPRGLTGDGEISPYGDCRYEVGKLHHSAVGKYDLIAAGAFSLQRHGPLDFSFSLPENESSLAVEHPFLESSFPCLTPLQAAAHPISILLFLSMLPLHADDTDRQLALLANAMRLFLELDNGRPA
jgi:hypothetical protein